MLSASLQHMLSERATFALVRELAADCEEFVDVGANEGAFTFLVHHEHPKMRLHWFEPDRQLAQRLAANLASNNIVALRKPDGGCGAKRDSYFLQEPERRLSSGSLSSLFTQKHLTRAETVETISLTEYFGIEGIADAMIKVDVEGAGEKVWNGAIEVSKAIRYLVMEMLAPEIEAGLPARIIHETDLKAYYIRDFELIPSVGGEFEVCGSVLELAVLPHVAERTRGSLVGNRLSRQQRSVDAERRQVPCPGR